MPRGRLYEPYGLTTRERADKRRVQAQARKKGMSLRKFCQTSQSRHCRLTRCIRKNEPRERRGQIRSAVAVCRVAVHGK